MRKGQLQLWISSPVPYRMKSRDMWQGLKSMLLLCQWLESLILLTTGSKPLQKPAPSPAPNASLGVLSIPPSAEALAPFGSDYTLDCNGTSGLAGGYAPSSPEDQTSQQYAMVNTHLCLPGESVSGRSEVPHLELSHGGQKGRVGSINLYE